MTEDPVLDFLLTAIVLLALVIVADFLARIHDHIVRRWPRKPGMNLPRNTRGTRKW